MGSVQTRRTLRNGVMCVSREKGQNSGKEKLTRDEARLEKVMKSTILLKQKL